MLRTDNKNICFKKAKKRALPQNGRVLFRFFEKAGKIFLDDKGGKAADLAKAVLIFTGGGRLPIVSFPIFRYNGEYGLLIRGLAVRKRGHNKKHEGRKGEPVPQ